MASRTGSKLAIASVLACGAAVLTYTGSASAQGHAIGIELATQLPPFDGEAEWDDVEVNGVNVRGDDDEDVEDNLGIAFHYLFELNSGLWLGPRAMWMGAEGDDSNIDYTTLDGGVALRYVFDTAKVLPFIQAGGGLTWLEVDEADDADGFGWHISGGGGCGFPVSDSVALYAGLILHRQATRVSGDINIGGGQQADFEADIVIFRGLTTFGVGF